MAHFCYIFILRDESIHCKLAVGDITYKIQCDFMHYKIDIVKKNTGIYIDKKTSLANNKKELSSYQPLPHYPEL